MQYTYCFKWGKNGGNSPRICFSGMVFAVLYFCNGIFTILLPIFLISSMFGI